MTRPGGSCIWAPGDASGINRVICWHRKQGMSVEDVIDFRRQIHGPLVREAAPALGLCRYVQTDAQPPGLLEPVVHMLGYGGLPYDGVAELWFERVEGFAAASTAFIVDEVEIVGKG